MNSGGRAKYTAYMGMMLALTAALSFLDSCISSVFPIPGIRLGLANVAILAVMALYGVPSAAAAAVLRSGFVLLTRGVSAGIMSLSGGIASFIVMTVMLKIFRRSERFSCIIGSVVHVTGQTAAACILTGSIRTMLYTPFIIPAAVVSGLLTGTVYEMLLRYMDKKRKD